MLKKNYTTPVTEVIFAEVLCLAAESGTPKTDDDNESGQIGGGDDQAAKGFGGFGNYSAWDDELDK